MEHYINDQDVRLFIDALRELEKSSATIQKYLRDVNHFINWVGSGFPIDKRKVIEYKQHLQKTYKLTSANSMLSALNTFFKLLNWNEYRVMTFKTQRANFRSEEKELSIREYHQLLQAAKETPSTPSLYILRTALQPPPPTPTTLMMPCIVSLTSFSKNGIVSSPILQLNLIRLQNYETIPILPNLRKACD